MKYYRLYSDIYYPERWYLGKINVKEPWVFREGSPLNEKEFKNLSVKVIKNGNSLDFTETVAEVVPIVSEKFTEWLYEYMDEVQLIPVIVPSANSSYYILNIKNNIDCIDEVRSDFEKFEEGNNIRPDLVGKYEMINILIIDKRKVNKAIFRLSNFDSFIIVNEDLKLKFENAGLTGVKFKLVVNDA